MTVTFILSAPPCPVCGYVTRGITIQSVRVNKGGSLRGTADGLSVLPGQCRECGWRLAFAVRRIDLHPDSAAEVAAYRARKGWAAA